MPRFSGGFKGKGGLVLPNFQVPVSSIVSMFSKSIQAGKAADVLDNVAADGTPAWRGFRIKTSEDPTLCELVIIDHVVTAGATEAVANWLAGGAANYTVLGALLMLACTKTDGADLGHIYGYAISGTLRYASTVNTEAASGGTIKPSFRIVTDGIEMAAHASFATRFTGFLVVLYA